MSKNYHKFVEVLRRWPVNNIRKDLDYGQYLRGCLKNQSEEVFPGSPEENSKKIDSLLRLSENKYQNECVFKFTKGATGMESKYLNEVLSVEFLEELKAAKK